MTIQQLAARWQVSVRTIQREIGDGRPQAVKKGSKTVISEETVAKYEHERRAKP